MSQYPGGQPPQDPYYGQPRGRSLRTRTAGASSPATPTSGRAAPIPTGSRSDPDYAAQQQAAYAQQQAYYAQQQAAQAQQRAVAEARRGRGGAGAAIVGVLLVLVGAWILFGDEIDLDFGQVWPIAAVALGVIMVIAAFIPRRER